MKKSYKTPMAKMIDFEYDEQIVAESGFLGTYGSGYNLQLCQMNSMTCTHYYNSGQPCKSTEMPFSLRRSE